MAKLIRMVNGVTVVASTIFLINSPAFAQGNQPSMGQHIMVYKTRKNYNNLVPITISEDKKLLFYYPAPTDIKIGNAYAVPTPLHKGYLLDRRGISLLSVFTKYTYKEYGRMKAVPTPDMLMDHIKDLNPMVELYDCGTGNATNSVAMLNKLIDSNQLTEKCKLVTSTGEQQNEVISN
jgi:hypothetical protein